MLLRASGASASNDYDLNSVTSNHIDPGVPNGQWLRALTEATIKNDWLALAEIRPQAEEAMGVQPTVDTLCVAAAFNGITRVADATGIPLDQSTADHTVELREQVGIARFSYPEKSTRYR